MALEIPRAIVDALARYNSTFRHPTLRPLEPSPLYALFPLELGAVTAPVGWPSEWPRGDGPGVYLIFGGEMQLIYVGKARRLGDRLGTYFKPSSSNRELCEIFRREEWWRTRPAFVATIACDADKAFDASAVEEYLIEVLQPAENKRGVRADEQVFGGRETAGIVAVTRKGGKDMNPETIRQSVQLWTSEPDKAKASPVVKASSEGAQAVVEAGPFSWRTDLPPTLGGENKAPSPTALLLGALAGCAAVFIRDTLGPQLGVRVDAVKAEVKCKADFRGLLGMPGALPDLDNLEIAIHIQSPESEEKVQGLYRAWLDRCPVYLALTKPLAVKTTLAGRA